MNDRITDQTDESGAAAAPSDEGDSHDPFSKGLYGKARRTLEEHELASPVGIRFMVDRIDSLENELKKLSEYRDKFYKADSDLRVERNRSSLDDITKKISAGLLAAGSAGAGTVASFLELSKFAVVIFIIFLTVAVSSFFIRVKPDAKS